MRSLPTSVVTLCRKSILNPSLLLLAAVSCGGGTDGSSSPLVADDETRADGAASGPTAVANNPTHDDPVDDADDASWVSNEVLEAGQSMLRLLLTDAPVEADSVFVTFCGVHVERTDGEVLDAGNGESSLGAAGAGGQAATGEAGAVESVSEPVAEACQTLDLLTLQNGVTEAIGVAALPPGDYGQIRLMLTDASIVVGGVEHDLVVPSSAESGLKVGNGFVLEAGVATTLTIDFDASKSVHYAPGNGYMMRPVVRMVAEQRHTPDAESGETRNETQAGSEDGSADGTEQGQPDAGNHRPNDRGRPGDDERPGNGNGSGSDEEGDSNN